MDDAAHETRTEASEDRRELAISRVRAENRHTATPREFELRLETTELSVPRE